LPLLFRSFKEFLIVFRSALRSPELHHRSDFFLSDEWRMEAVQNIP
jgi:hypothetical protein